MPGGGTGRQYEEGATKEKGGEEDLVHNVMLSISGTKGLIDMLIHFTSRAIGSGVSIHLSFEPRDSVSR